jgi:1,4-alpha-glucan branching enzyme
MGWMNDSLRYIAMDPVYRSYHHHDMTFSLLYSFSEKFILPLSHDEVVHGKKSIFGRMPGDKWQALATMRAYLAFMWCHPGKKLVFMGTELAAPREWNHDAELPWHLLDDPAHKTMQRYLRDLNTLYRERPTLYELDHASEGFVWLRSDDYVQSVFAFLRVAKDGSQAIVVSNFTPIPRFEYRIGIPQAGRWAEILNSDSDVYGGSNVGNGGFIHTENLPWQNQPFSASISVPPLATVIFGLP